MATTPAPPDPSPTEGSLEERLDAVLTSTEGIRDAIEKENKTRDVRIKRSERAIFWSRIATVIVVIVAIFGVGVGASGRQDARRADQRAGRAEKALSAYKAQRAEVSIQACLAANLQTDRTIAYQKVLSEDFVAALVNGSTDPATLARAATFNRSHDAIIETGLPHRDCSAAVAGKGKVVYLPTGQPSP